MNIHHDPLLNIDKVIDLYSKKDGVDISYVCTTDLNASDVPVDVFFRSTPHPQFGNRYFGLYRDVVRDVLMITNADVVEDYDFGMIESDGTYYYSQSHHDCKFIGNQMIDGGRVYCRSSALVSFFKVKDGQFIRNTNEDQE